MVLAELALALREPGSVPLSGPRGPGFAFVRDSCLPEEIEFDDGMETREGLLDTDPGDEGGLTEERRLDAPGRWCFFVGEDMV